MLVEEHYHNIVTMDWQKTYCNIILTYYCYYSVQQCCTMILATFLTESVTLGRGIKWWCCLTSVCLLHTSGLSREQRGLGRLKFAQRYPTSHMTQTPLSRSKGQMSGQGHEATLLIAVLAHQAVAAVGVGTCWPWETAATLPSAQRRKALWHSGEERGGGISWRPPARLQLV